MLTERVGRVPKGAIRRRLIPRLRHAVAGRWDLGPFGPVPFPFVRPSTFASTLTSGSPDYADWLRGARYPLADCCTHFVNTHAYADEPGVLWRICFGSIPSRTVTTTWSIGTRRRIEEISMRPMKSLWIRGSIPWISQPSRPLEPGSMACSRTSVTSFRRTSNSGTTTSRSIPGWVIGFRRVSAGPDPPDLRGAFPEAGCR